MPAKQFDGAVSSELLQTIVDLQKLPAFANFALAGGTSLALRYNHRRSIDIDLFSNTVIGVAGLENMLRALESRYRNALVYCEILDPAQGEQYCFLRALVSTGNTGIKVEAIQNVQVLDPVEVVGEIRLFSKRDIALMKLMSAANRMARKDIYDLDLLSDEIPLDQLLAMLEKKLTRFQDERFKCLFDLDGEKSPVNDPGLLLAFDNVSYAEIPGRPNHSNDNIDIAPGGKDWISARSAWKMKVKTVMHTKGQTPPPAKPIN